jgi:uncharacterized membrane protein YbaN (DUF454 family)
MAISSLKKWTLIISGSTALGLGVLGIFLPLLPTTVFLLIAAACYARSSDRLYTWLMNHKWFGPYIRNWREHKAMPLKSKIVILLLMWTMLPYSTFRFVDSLIVRIILLGIGAIVTFFIVRMKTLTPDTLSKNT